MGERNEKCIKLCEDNVPKLLKLDCKKYCTNTNELNPGQISYLQIEDIYINKNLDEFVSHAKRVFSNNLSVCNVAMQIIDCKLLIDIIKRLNSSEYSINNFDKHKLECFTKYNDNHVYGIIIALAQKDNTIWCYVKFRDKIINGSIKSPYIVKYNIKNICVVECINSKNCALKPYEQFSVTQTITHPVIVESNRVMNAVAMYMKKISDKKTPIKYIKNDTELYYDRFDPIM